MRGAARSRREGGDDDGRNTRGRRDNRQDSSTIWPDSSTLSDGPDLVVLLLVVSQRGERRLLINPVGLHPYFIALGVSGFSLFPCSDRLSLMVCYRFLQKSLHRMLYCIDQTASRTGPFCSRDWCEAGIRAFYCLLASPS